MVTSQEKENGLFFVKNIGELTLGCPLRTLTTTSADKLKNLFVRAKFPRTHFVQTVHGPKEGIKAFDVPTIRVEFLTHHNCSRLNHTCLHCNKGSCRIDESPIIEVDNVCR